jgi:alkanesulfonate monooxygenase SsuD/methylene tetrahydromethanopterin reductase-like flavin-dependent oxidoreductase (luciferase family)
MTNARSTGRGLGLAAATPPDVIDAAARSVASGGFDSFWLNNPPQGGAVPLLGSVAPEVQGLHLGVGVIPLSHHPPEEIAREVEGSGIPLERFYLGIGSGTGGGGVERVSLGVEELRNLIQTSIVIAALGPRMCRLGGEVADGVLLNWLTPEWARRSVAWIEEAAASFNRPVPRIMAYVRVALGPAGTARLHAEASRYEGFPAYAAHFKRMGVPAAGTAVFADRPDALQNGLAAWNGIVDEVVVRAVPAEDTTEDVLTVVEAVRQAR